MTTLAEMALANTLRERLTTTFASGVTVHALTPLHGGAGQENFRLEVEVADGPNAGFHVYALRGDALHPVPNTLHRRDEAEVIRAAVRAGVRTPTVEALLTGLFGRAHDAFLTEFMPGIALGTRLVSAPEFELARTRLPLQLAEALAVLHGLTPATHPDLPIDRAPFLASVDPVAAQIAWFEQSLDGFAHPRPASEYVLRWLRRHPPASRELTLVHGDFRTGNFLTTEQGLSAVLDWECAHWGSPLEDLAWLCVRDWRFGRIDRVVGGFAELDPFLAAYVDLSGRPIRPGDLHWWMVAGNLRWAIGALQFSGRTGPAEIENLAIPKRAPEMEFEALRLIEVGV